MQNFVKVAKIGDVRPGQSSVVEVEGEQVALFNVDGVFYATGNVCPHRKGPIGEGALDEDIVTCPLHGWRFNVKTGKNAIMPMPGIPTYNVKVEGNDVFVSLK